MMFHRPGLIHRNQRGFTIIELLIAFALTGILAGATTTAIFQVFSGSVRSSNHMTAVRQVQNAGYWVSRDAQMAETVTLGASDGFPLELSWTDYLNNPHTATYTLVSSELRRDYDEQLMRVAQYIDSTNTSCQSTVGGMLIFTVTATVGSDSQGKSETRVYEVIPRPGS